MKRYLRKCHFPEGEQWWRVRFQVLPVNSSQTTRLQFKLWPRLQTEPSEWFFRDEITVEYKGVSVLYGLSIFQYPDSFDDLEIRSN